MAFVVLLRGVNVGGHRTFRPTIVAERLKHLGAVNIGTAGTFVIRQSVTQRKLRAELARRLPFDADVMICPAREIVSLLSRDYFAGRPVRPDIVRFVSVLSGTPRSKPSTPIRFPAAGQWLLKILAIEDRFVVGVYRRHMRTIGYLGALDKVVGRRATTRSWKTMAAIVKVLGDAGA